MILDANGMPILQPAVDNAETATFNTAFAAIGSAIAGAVPIASTTVSGSAEFATDAEAIAGVEPALVVTTTGLKAALTEPVFGVIPSSIVVGSGSASVDAFGLVTFTGVSSVSLNDIFDGLGADIYEIFMTFANGTSGSASTRLRDSGTDESAASYFYTATNTTLSTGPSRASNSAYASFGWWCPGSTTSYKSMGEMVIYKPALADTTHARLASNSQALGDRLAWTEYGGSNLTKAFDGLSIIPSAGTITGMMKVVKVA